MFCNKCGQRLADGVSVCPNCGNVLPIVNAAGTNSVRLKSTFGGAGTPMPTAPDAAPVDVSKTYSTPVEFNDAPATAPASAPAPGYTASAPYGSPAPTAPSYSAAPGYTAASTPAYPSYSYDAAGHHASAETKKGVGGRIARSILVSILLIIVLFGPMYDTYGGGLLPDNYRNTFENFEGMEELFEYIEYSARYDRGEMLFYYVTSLVAFFMLIISTVGSFISGLCNGKGAVRAFSILGIVSIALYVTALIVVSSAGYIDFADATFDPDRGMFHVGMYASFVIFIVNCAIAGKD